MKRYALAAALFLALVASPLAALTAATDDAPDCGDSTGDAGETWRQSQFQARHVTCAGTVGAYPDGQWDNLDWYHTTPTPDLLSEKLDVTVCSLDAGVMLLYKVYYLDEDDRLLGDGVPNEAHPRYGLWDSTPPGGCDSADVDQTYLQSINVTWYVAIKTYDDGPWREYTLRLD